MNPRISLLFTIAFLVLSTKLQAQHSSYKHGLLWEISGKKLSEPSYLFGTYHLLNEDYVNSLKGWKEKFDLCKVVVGEIVMDSSKLQGLYASMMMKDNTLDKLLTPEEYKKTGDFLKEVSGYEINIFNQFKPFALSSLLTVFAWAKQNPNDYNPAKLGMDMYFQKLGKEDDKKLVALETMEEQAAMMFDKISIQRQKEMLVAMVNNKHKTSEELNVLDKCYRDQDLQCMLESFFVQEWDFKKEELDILVNNRNKTWVPQLIAIIEKEPAFIAVGAGHLPGNEGLLNLLKQQGYTIKVVNLK